MPRRYVETDLGQVHLRIEGSGPALLLLGSTGRSSRMFEPLLPLLRGHFQVLAPDLPGCGQSDPLPPGITIPALAGCMAQVLDALGIHRAHVYGFHTGNKIATALAANWPQRVGRLVLAGQSHSLIPSSDERNRVIGGRTRNYFADRDAGDPLAKAIRDWTNLQRSVNEVWSPPALQGDGPQRAAALAQARRQVLDELECAGAIPALYEANFAYDLQSDLKRIAAPTLVLEIETPDERRTLGAQAPAVCALVRGASSRSLSADGFRLTLEDQAEELAAVLLEFLGDSAGA